MADDEQPQIYLITPPEIELLSFGNMLSGLLDTVEVACVRLSLSTQDEGKICKAGDAMREITHARDVALVISEHVGMVERLGLDGVHLTDGSRSVRKVRKDLGGDAIVGTYCGASRHDGMTAAESGVDYVSFGPVSQTPLGTGDLAEPDLFQWWSEMIEVPIVAEGGLSEESFASLSEKTDFFAVGQEIWNTDDPAATLKRFMAAMK